MITLAGFKPYINSLKDKRKSRSSIVPNVLFFMKFPSVIRSDRGRDSHKKRLLNWCGYYSTNSKGMSLPKNVVTPRIRKVLEHRKIVDGARKKFVDHTNRIKYANRRAAMSKIEESQCYSDDRINFRFENVYDWWDFREARHLWHGHPKSAEYYRRVFAIVPWLEENAGRMIEPVLCSSILYGNGWVLNLGECSLRFSKKISDKMRLLFVLRWM